MLGLFGVKSPKEIEYVVKVSGSLVEELSEEGGIDEELSEDGTTDEVSSPPVDVLGSSEGLTEEVISSLESSEAESWILTHEDKDKTTLAASTNRKGNLRIWRLYQRYV